jgi:hypothetical protein
MIRERLARELIKSTADRFGQLFIIVKKIIALVTSDSFS